MMLSGLRAARILRDDAMMIIDAAAGDMNHPENECAERCCRDMLRVAPTFMASARTRRA